MISDAKLLEMVYMAAWCYIPDEELDESQLERLDNIRYQWCRCRYCSVPLKIEGKVVRPQFVGHTDKRTQICISKRFLKEHIELPPPTFLVTLISTCLHEIVHMIFPELSEEQVVKKTFEWLRRPIYELGDLGTS